MTLISCDTMAEQTRNEKDACTGTVEPCEGKALVLSSDDQSARIIKRRSKCLYYQATTKVLVPNDDAYIRRVKRP